MAVTVDSLKRILTMVVEATGASKALVNDARDELDTVDTDVTALQNGAVPITATTAELAAAGNAINTTNKVVGKMVWDTTLGQPVWADGAAAGDTWSLSTGVVAHNP